MSKLSKSSLSIRKKWQREAVKRGGQNAKIVISQSQGMPIICNHLRNSFSPMNITSIYEVSLNTLGVPVALPHERLVHHLFCSAILMSF